MLQNHFLTLETVDVLVVPTISNCEKPSIGVQTLVVVCHHSARSSQRFLKVIARGCLVIHHLALLVNPFRHRSGAVR